MAGNGILLSGQSALDVEERSVDMKLITISHSVLPAEGFFSQRQSRGPNQPVTITLHLGEEDIPCKGLFSAPDILAGFLCRSMYSQW